MKYPADYTIKLKSGVEIPLLFNFYGNKKLSEQWGIEYDVMAQGCMNKDDGSLGDTIKINNLPDILLSGHKTWCRFNEVECTATELEACLWMDELPWRTSKELEAILRIFSSHLLVVDLNDVSVKPTEQPADSKKKAGTKKK